MKQETIVDLLMMYVRPDGSLHLHSTHTESLLRWISNAENAQEEVKRMEAELNKLLKELRK